MRSFNLFPEVDEREYIAGRNARCIKDKAAHVSCNVGAGGWKNTQAEQRKEEWTWA
jgi:hypothetical protein